MVATIHFEMRYLLMAAHLLCSIDITPTVNVKRCAIIPEYCTRFMSQSAFSIEMRCRRKCGVFVYV